MTATDPTAAALLRAVIANPGDELARLVYAERLQELGEEQQAIVERILAQPDCDQWRLDYATWLERQEPGRVPCPVYEGMGDQGSGSGVGYNCPKCKGTGFIPDTNLHDRAEIIRVQCELVHDSHGKYGCRKCTSSAVAVPAFSEEDCCCRFKPLYVRESALLAKHRANWLRVGACPACEGSRTVTTRTRTAEMDADDYGLSTYACPACAGTGDIGMLPDTIEFARGFPHRVTVPTLADVWGAKGPTPRARAWVTHFPIAEIVVGDREPLDITSNGKRFFRWWSDMQHPHIGRYTLPVVVFLLMGGEDEWKNVTPEDYCKNYPTRELALSALASGLAQAVREYP